jgi:hypothetical protein
MIIRSQDETVITTDLNLRLFNPSDTEEYKIICDAVGFIGTYSTKEKAIKVLDMICEKAFVQANVFQMPQDSEV